MLFRAASFLKKNLLNIKSLRLKPRHEINASESVFRELYEDSPVGVSLTDTDGKIHINQAFCCMIGYTRGELAEKKWEDITWPEDISNSSNIADQLLKGHINKAQYEKRYIHKNGNPVWAEISTCLKRDDQNRPKYFISVIHNISERKRAEEILRESELKHRIVADNTYDWEFWTDLEDRFVYCSPSCLRITGYTADEFISDPSLVLKIIHSDDHELYTGHLAEAKRNELASGVNYRIIRKDNSERWIGHVCQPIYDDNGISIGRRGSNRDITFQIKAVEELRKSGERFKSYFEVSMAGIAITSPDKKWLDVNEYLCRILGYTREELVNLTWSELTHPDDIGLDLDKFEKVLSGEIDGYSMEKRFIRKNGNTIWTSLSVKCVRQKSGEVDYFMALLFDITERKQAELKLAWERYLMNSLLDSIPDYIYFKDENGRFLRMNKSLSDALNLESPIAAIGKTMDDILGVRQHAEAQSDEQEIIRTGLPLIGKEEISTRPDQLPRWISSTKMPLKDLTGKIIGTFGISRDITDKRQIQDTLLKALLKAEESDRVKTAFLQNISHEIRTPLNAIIGFSTFLANPNLPANKRKEFIEIISASNDQLLSIISGIMAAATLDAGQEIISEKETNINTLIRKIYDQLQINRDPAGVAFIYHNALPDEEAYTFTDETKLMQILVNLTDNALKFTKKGFVKLGYEKCENQLQFYVEDTGIGIPEEMHNQIFERFVQVDNTSTRKYGGTGLGLALVKGYVGLLGGSIQLNSKPGEGSLFTVILPYKPINNM